MPYLKLQDRLFPLVPGEATIGAFDGASIRLPSGDPATRAVVLVEPSGVSIRRGSPDAVVLVNGVQLGVEPTPLLHGDRVEMAGHELRVGEDQQGGNTAFVKASDIAKLVKPQGGSTAPKKPTSATGGRLVSLVDGREYAVPEDELTFGREVGNTIVIASSEISRKHASIVAGPDGYVLRDHSTNGVWVNGTRVAEQQTLGRGDVIKMGTEEFRFYADVAKAAPPVAQAPPAAAALAATMVGVPAAVPAPAPAAAAAPRPSTRVALAHLEVIAEGPLKGMRFELHSALTNIGRGEHNDIAIKDDSISDSHAKLQKRPDGWWVVDQGSTNGTYIGGRRVAGEQRIEGAPDLRFGGIKMRFLPAAVPAAEGAGTRAIAAVNVEAMRAKTQGGKPLAATRPMVPAAADTQKKGCASMIALIVTIAGAGVGLLGLLMFVGR